MKSRADIEREIEDLLKQNYYSPDFEFSGAAKRYAASLSAEEIPLFREVVVARLSAEPSIANVMLADACAIPAAVPLLVELLGRQQVTSQLTRAAITALERYRNDEAFSAVERFLDSEQETEALLSLARMDFRRTLAHVRKAVRKDHLLGACLQVFHERRKAVGLPALVEDLKLLATDSTLEIRDRLHKVFLCKRGAYNPFKPEEVVEILAVLHGG